MPHSTKYENAPGADGQGAMGMLNMYGDYDIPENFDTTGKADDAFDYADLDDDESLPEEEEATNTHLEDEDENDAFSSAMTGEFAGVPAQSSPGLAAVDAKPATTDLFGENMEDIDLFGERFSSPEDERHAQNPSQPLAKQQKAPNLALPNKSSLALPRPSAASSIRPSPSSLSPQPFLRQQSHILSPPETTSDDDDDDDDMDEEARKQRDLQRELFRISKKRNAGEDIAASGPQTDFDVFHQLFSGYEEYQIPRFIELFPPREIHFRGKEPPKPPKAVIPTKLALELLPDQERSFRAFTTTNKGAQESSYQKSFITARQGNGSDDGDGEDLGLDDFDLNERIGGVTMQDLALICEDWDIPSIDGDSVVTDTVGDDTAMDDGWDAEELSRPAKKRKTQTPSIVIALPAVDPYLSFDDPERTVARIAKTVTLDLNDPKLLIDEHATRASTVKKRAPGDGKRDPAASRDLFKRYNISNDQAYDLLKENHQNKVRSTLGNTTVEHSFPATILQYPFYKVSLDTKAKRSFHRPHLELKNQPGREYRFQKPKHIKKKNWRGKEAKEIYAKAEDLSLGDNASALLLEYAEEAPMMISNFGMGNRLINYYRKKDADDQERPKRDIGETQILLPQDKSPFSTFGCVDSGEIVPTIQNGLYRAPVFSHEAKPTDFLIGISSTYENGDRFFLRNVENLHVVGQQFPSEEIPGQHSRKVTDAAKKRLRALAYRIYTKSLERKDKVLDNATLLPHLPGHDMPQTRSKMREFMKYEKVSKAGGNEGNGVWVPPPGTQVPNAETMRGWIRPEAVCVLDSMQVGVQHLADLGISETKDGDEDKDVDESANIELQLAPWRATKNFLNACQSKAMLKLHGEGDPTGRGEGFSFVKTSMKGGFTAFGESVEDKIDARRRKENGGHSYNVAKQQKAYEDSIRRIWDAQKAGLSRVEEDSDEEMDNEPQEADSSTYGRAATPRSSVGPGAMSRHEDESASQFSGMSAGHGEKTLVITRKGGYDRYGQPMEDTVEVVTNPRVIALYQKRRTESKLKQLRFAISSSCCQIRSVHHADHFLCSVHDMRPTGDTELDAIQQQKLQAELARVQRNVERREARDKAKGKHGLSRRTSTAVGSPGGESDSMAIDSPGAGATPAKGTGKGRSKDGTARKCANCGQVGHIKTNRKSVQCFFCFSIIYLDTPNRKQRQPPSSSNRCKADRQVDAEPFWTLESPLLVL
jgi:transcription initiation factor TFIID subunit 1